MRTAIAEVVVDASALVEWLLPGPRYGDVQSLFEDNTSFLLAPDLIFAEAADALRKVWRSGALSTDDFAVALEDLAAVDVAFVASRVLVPVLRPLLEEVTAYDAMYLALALAREVPLATFDRTLAEAALQRDVPVVLEP